MKEIRYADITTAGEMVLEGFPVVFEQPTEIHMPDGGSFTEIIHKGALDGCELNDSRLLYEHDERSIPFARTGRTMRLEITERGLHMVANLAGDNPDAVKLYSAIKRGDLDAMSFGFTVTSGSRYDGATNVRHIDHIDRIYECSIVKWPAYQTASVEARAQVQDGTLRQRCLRMAQAARAMATISTIKGGH